MDPPTFYEYTLDDGGEMKDAGTSHGVTVATPDMRKNRRLPFDALRTCPESMEGTNG
jgi:hypothetical protein